MASTEMLATDVRPEPSSTVHNATMEPTDRGMLIAHLECMDAVYNVDSRTRSPRHPPQLLLPDHHRRIEAMCQSMLGWAYANDSRELSSHWRALETELIDHMTSEEEIILPGYRVHAPVDAALILDDHARIRNLMTPIGIDVDLHEIRAARLRGLVDALDAHALQEDAAMYPWAERNVPMVAQRMLFARVDRGFGRP